MAAWDGPLNALSDVLYEIPQDYKGKEGDLAMRVPGRIIASEALLPHITDDLAPEQVANVASLPGIVGHSLAMPDIHWGYGFPIGGVAAFDPDEGGVVSPGGVGFDINCGVRLLRTDLSEEEVRPRLKEVMEALYQTVPAGLGSRGKETVPEGALADIMTEGARWAVEEGFALERDLESMEEEGRIEGAEVAHVSERARTRGRRSLGSLGSGNHFLEVQFVDELFDAAAAKAFGVASGDVVVMIHTGSRGLGHQVCQDHLKDLQGVPAREGIALPDRQLACAPLGSKEADAYMGAMAAAANFAFVNRSILMARTRDALEALFPGTEVGLVYDVCHNIAKWEEHTIPGTDTRKRLCVHRKGATRAFWPGHPELPARYAEAGQPVIVPGDMGRQSFLLAGSPESERMSFGSSCHGAGRQMSRTKAKKSYQGRQLIDMLWKEKGIVVRATSQNVAAEEAPEAYKDVSQVVDSVEKAQLARKVARLKPMGVVKG